MKYFFWILFTCGAVHYFYQSIRNEFELMLRHSYPTLPSGSPQSPTKGSQALTIPA